MNTTKILFLFILILPFSCRPSQDNSSQPGERTERTNPRFLSPGKLYGPLLSDVQMGRVFPDDKTFMDYTPKMKVGDILSAYETQKGKVNFDLKKFVSAHFEEPVKMDSDFQTDPTINANEHINAIWPFLRRDGVPPETAGSKINTGTLIPVPNPHVVAGGSVGDIQYWEGYFIMLGLQAAGKVDLIENMLDNYSWLIDNFDFIPGSNRTYNLGRSQPPFFALMVGVLADMKGEEVYAKYLPFLEKEYAFWMEGMERLSPTYRTHRRLVRLGDGSVLNRFWDDFDGPRDEAYRADVLMTEKGDRPAEGFYKDIRAACESGWEMNSRWYRDGRSPETIHTTEILPVDLNALLYNLEMTIARAHRLDGNAEKEAFFNQRARQRKEAMLSYHWHSPVGFFMDFDYVVGEPTYIPSLAGVYPLCFNMVKKEYALAIAQNIEEDFLRPGGLLSTLFTTGESWDAPYGSAPGQWMAIMGLRNYGFVKLADTVKHRWITLCRKVYRETGKMVEKYNVQNLEEVGGGGEYPGQDGYGWTNGVLLRLMTE